MTSMHRGKRPRALGRCVTDRAEGKRMFGDYFKVSALTLLLLSLQYQRHWNKYPTKLASQTMLICLSVSTELHRIIDSITLARK